MIIYNGGPNLSLGEVVLFPFDDYSLPFQRGVRLQLIPNKGDQIVVPFGPPGAPDSKGMNYYGAVCRVGDELWMWYLGGSQVCFAKSTDGYNWERPSLGLIEHNGSTQNNLVDLGGAAYKVVACVVIYEPEDPDPNRRFKMVYETHRRNPSHGGRAEFNVAVSADGLRWTEIQVNPHYVSCEMGGFIKFNGCYYVSAQSGGGHFPRPERKLETFVSYDFENWVEADCMGLLRGNLPPRPMVEGSHAGEQIHLGAGLWNRENVIIGIYGQWHGHPTNDRSLIAMDLGLVVSNDALHYREPIPDFRIVPAGENSADRLFGALMQGQGFDNINGETLFWYAPWGGCNGIRVAKWEQDRLGYFEAFLGMKMNSLQESHFVSAAIDLEGKPAKVEINVSGLSEYTDISVEILTERFEAISGFGRDECTGPKESGLRQLVTWGNRESLEGIDGKVRVRVNFGGIRPEDVKIHAIYVSDQASE